MILSFLSVSGTFSRSPEAQTSNLTTISRSSLLHTNIVPTQGSSTSARSVIDTISSCSMDNCFNYSRCDKMEELLVYHYDSQYSPDWYFKDALKRSPYYTTNPAEACLFLVVDRRRVGGPPLSRLPYWNHGLNHVVISVVDKPRNPDARSIEMASTMTSITHQTIYRAGFDVSVPLPQRKFYPNLQRLSAMGRKYLLTYKGNRCLEVGSRGGRVCIDPVLRGMHNGKDIVVVTTCKQVSSNEVAKVEARCAKDQFVYDQYKFDDLINSTFALVPAGSGVSSYRLMEVLSAGSIPVAISESIVLPFDSLIEWRRCLFVFPPSQMHRIVPTLQTLNKDEIEFRREHCLFIYRQFFGSDDKVVATTAMAFKSRFFGVLPKLIPNVPLPPRHLSLKQQQQQQPNLKLQ